MTAASSEALPGRTSTSFGKHLLVLLAFTTVSAQILGIPEAEQPVLVYFGSGIVNTFASLILAAVPATVSRLLSGNWPKWSWWPAYPAAALLIWLAFVGTHVPSNAPTIPKEESSENWWESFPMVEEAGAASAAGDEEKSWGKGDPIVEEANQDRFLSHEEAWGPYDPDQLRPSAESGDPLAQAGLGVAYKFGMGRERDFAAAARWYRAALEQGLERSNEHLGFDLASLAGQLAMLYWSGRGVEQDPLEAVRWFRVAAELGDLKASRFLAHIFFAGDRVAQDQVESARWVRLAAEQGDVDSQFVIGQLYVWGEGVDQDGSKAIHWLSLASKQGETEADVQLGRLHFLGPTDTSMGHPRPGSGGHSLPSFNMAKLMNAFTS